jgi:hypothetical protein
MKSSNKHPASNPMRNFRKVSLELELPRVEIAFHDEDSEGLLPISALAKPVRVDFKVWLNAVPDDLYQLYWDEACVGDPKLISSDQQIGDPLFLEIPVEFLTEGVHKLAYQTTNHENGVTEESLPIRIEVDLTPPGKPQLGPIKFPPEVDGGLTSNELTQLGDQLDVEIGSYTGMAKHDVIRTFWGDIEGPGAIVDADDMGVQRVIITYTREFLETLGDFNGVVSYTINDRAGNLSARSLGIFIHLLLKEAPNDFPAPIIDLTVGDLIDHAEAKAGINVDIPGYPGAEPLDLITLHWGDGNSSSPFPLPEGNEGEDVVLSILVPYETIAVEPVGSPRITYDVVREGKLLGSSLPSIIDVFLTLPVEEALEAPVVQGTSVTSPNTDDNFIDEDDYELNGRAIIQWRDEFELSDDLNLHWGQEFVPQWYQIRASDIAAARDLNIPIPNSIIKAQGTGAEIPVRYTLTRFDNPNPADSPTQLVIVRSKEETPGGVDGLNGPTFNTHENGVVGPIENPDGAEVTIAPYTNILKNQVIQFTFVGFDNDNNPIVEAGFYGERELDSNDVVNGYKFKIPGANLKRICIGYGEASYKVLPAEDSNQSPATSRVTRVRINMSKPTSGCNWKI